MRAPAIAIASFVRGRDGAAYPTEILERFYLAQSTLRRRRPELARLGIVFISDGNRSMYVTRELADQVPTKYPPNGATPRRARAAAGAAALEVRRSKKQERQAAPAAGSVSRMNFSRCTRGSTSRSRWRL